MTNPLALLKAAKAGFGPDQWAEMLSAMGIQVTVFPVEGDHVPGAFQGVAESTLVPDSKVFVVRGVMKNGEQMEAIFVMVPAQKVLSLVPPPKG